MERTVIPIKNEVWLVWTKWTYQVNNWFFGCFCVFVINFCFTYSWNIWTTCNTLHCNPSVFGKKYTIYFYLDVNLFIILKSCYFCFFHRTFVDVSFVSNRLMVNYECFFTTSRLFFTTQHTITYLSWIHLQSKIPKNVCAINNGYSNSV